MNREEIEGKMFTLIRENMEYRRVMNREEIEGKMLMLIRENMEYRRAIRVAEGYAKDLEKNEEELRKLFLQLD